MWHYGRSIRSYFSVWGNFFWFAYNFFSIPLLLRTLFSPFERLSEEYRKGLDLSALASTLLVNLIMRLVGAAVRGVIIIFGLGALCFVAAAGLLLLVAWILLPFIVFAFFLLGVHGLIEWI
jgi:hypothetical protein